MKKVYILYHKNCTDGFGAAYSAWKKFKDSAEYIEVNYNEPVPTLEKNSIIYILDFCYKKNTLLKLMQESEVIILDHHFTAKENIVFSNYHIYDENRSGAKIAWNYFHPNVENELIEYISDKDLSRFILPFSKEIISSLESYPRDFNVWDKLSISKLKEEGSHILRNKKNEIKLSLDKVFFTQIGGHVVPVINTSVFMSEIAEQLLEEFPEYPFSATFYFFEKDGIIFKKWSLRSKNFDISHVAEKLGGGGHKFASAFIEKVSNNYNKKGEVI